MKHISRIHSALFAALFLLLGTATAQTVVSFWSHTHPPMVTLNEELIAEFEDQNPDIRIDYEVIPNSQFFEKMIVSLSTGTGPDVINMGNAQLASDYIPRGLVAELDPIAVGYSSLEELQENYLPSGLKGAELDGTYYGLPSEFNANLLMVHVPDLVDAGYPEDWAPSTWDELGEVAGELSKFDANGNQTHRGFDFLYLHASWYFNQFSELADQAGCRFYNEEGTESTIADPECIVAANIWKDMIYKYEAANPALTAGDSTVPLQDYIAGDVSMIITQPWGIELVREGAPDRWENSRLVQIPQVNPDNPLNQVSGYYWAVSADSDVQEAAWKFVGFLASHPERWLADVNFLQASASLGAEAEDALPYLEEWNNALAIGEFTPNNPNANETNEALKAALEAILFNDEDTEAALTDLQARLQRALR